jgi:transposase-like protein
VAVEEVEWVMVRSRRTKIPAAEKTRLVLAVLAGEMTGAEAARRCGVASTQVTKWKHQFLEAGAQRMEEVPSAMRVRSVELLLAHSVSKRVYRLIVGIIVNLEPHLTDP